MQSKRDLKENEGGSLAASTKKRYEPPRILAREPLEVSAACSLINSSIGLCQKDGKS